MACPICNRQAPPRSDNPAAPFCSARCKQIDLGNWLSNAYRVNGQDGSVDPEAVDDLYVTIEREEGV
jgi:endogenous inhibitor of DNA gyrase (YacG/DUF329 family)